MKVSFRVLVALWLAFLALLTSAYNVHGSAVEGRNLQEGYKPSQVLSILHTKRFGAGNNEFKLPNQIDVIREKGLSGSNDFLNGEESDYYTGVVAGGITMLIILFLWLVVIFTSCCIESNCGCSETCLLVTIVISIIGAVLGWVISFGGNVAIQDGFDGTENGSNAFTTALNNATDLLRSVAQEGSSFVLPETCDVDAAQADAFTTQAALLFGQVADASDTISSTSDTMDDLVSGISSIIDVVSRLYLFFIIFMIVLTLLILSLACIKIDQVRSEASNRELTFISDLAVNRTCCYTFSNVVVFSFGLILVTAVWIFVAILSAFAVAGSDLCVEDPGVNIQAALLSSIPDVNASLIAADKDFCTIEGEVTIEQLSTEEIVGNTVCFYTECRGSSVFLNNIDLDSVIQDADTLLEDLKTDQTDQECLDGLTALQDTLSNISISLELVIDELDCEGLQPTISNTLDEELCNSVITGAGIIYVSWATGAAGMMLAMALYLNISEEVQNEFHALTTPERKRLRDQRKSVKRTKKQSRHQKAAMAMISSLPPLEFEAMNIDEEIRDAQEAEVSHKMHYVHPEDLHLQQEIIPRRNDLAPEDMYVPKFETQRTFEKQDTLKGADPVDDDIEF